MTPEQATQLLSLVSDLRDVLTFMAGTLSCFVVCFALSRTGL